ncbi:hypothetical protein ADL22_12645 [Streptomyces sp. NRRL F-4489]|uniref:hypothetical protein n=1 Tax=Streptomyces sp. NRRL F-4489 TaxID=1609095 RepID=UPI000749FA3B|nr:hypothetical protein [Streptomyces sp. NRRL F-4489]KUL44785.1 hypothetical protein ADL22_12645 [Streptomyces sp. NRRL F-4489]
MDKPVVVSVDIVEPGVALVTLPNGGARLGRSDGKYWADIYEDSDVEAAAGQYKEGFATYDAAARWVARTHGYDGPLDIQKKRDPK